MLNARALSIYVASPATSPANSETLFNVINGNTGIAGDTSFSDKWKVLLVIHHFLSI